MRQAERGRAGEKGRERERERDRERERHVKYYAALLVPCACMMYTTRPQALSLQAKERMLGNYICVCDNINNTCTCCKVTTYFYRGSGAEILNIGELQ